MGLLVDEIEEPRISEQEYRSIEGIQIGIQSKRRLENAGERVRDMRQ